MAHSARAVRTRIAAWAASTTAAVAVSSPSAASCETNSGQRWSLCECSVCFLYVAHGVMYSVRTAAQNPWFSDPRHPFFQKEKCNALFSLSSSPLVLSLLLFFFSSLSLFLSFSLSLSSRLNIASRKEQRLCLPFARIQLLVRNKQTAKSLSNSSMQALLRQSEKTGGLGFLEASQGVSVSKNDFSKT